MVSEARLRKLHYRWDNVLTWKQWEEIYKPIPNPNREGEIAFDWVGKDLEELRKYPAKNVWTGIDGGGRYIEILSGIHRVNRLEYYVTEVPWERDLCVTNNPNPD